MQWKVVGKMIDKYETKPIEHSVAPLFALLSEISVRANNGLDDQ